MKNNKGFTIIELAVSFCLIAAVSITLLQLVLTLKEVYLSGDVKTTLLNKQGIMTKKIYDDLNNKNLNGITACGVSCLTFSYDGAYTADLKADIGNKTLTYGDYTIKLDSTSFFDKFKVTIEEPNESLGKVDSLIKIDIPIVSRLLDEDFGIHILKTYNKSNVVVNTTLNTPSAIVAGIDVTFKQLYSWNSAKQAFVLDGVFVPVLKQKKDTYFADFNSSLKNNNPNSYSILKGLEAFRQFYKIDDMVLKDALVALNLSSETEAFKKKIDDKKEEIKSNYNNGYFSFILNYNDEELQIYNSSLTTDDGKHLGDYEQQNYNWWSQTSNFANKEPLAGFSISQDKFNIIANSKMSGITYDANNNYLYKVSSTDYVLGLKNKIGSLNGIPYYNGEANSYTLYADAREYLCNYSLAKVLDKGQEYNKIVYNDGYHCE